MSRLACVISAAAALPLAACSGPAAPCLPPEAAAWTAPGPAVPDAVVPPRQVDVYIDESGSMAGFIRGAAAADRPLNELVARLPWIGGGETQSYTLFGKTLHTVTGEAETRLATEAPYACTQGWTPCDKDQTRLDVVLQKIKAAPRDHLSVVVTDLWLTGADLPDGPAALSRPLADILRAGGSLGVLGVTAPYRGPIYDIPNAPDYGEATSHPLYVLIIGPVDAVERVHDNLARLREGSFGPDKTHWSLFSLAPFRADAATRQPLSVTAGAGIVDRPFVTPRPDLDVQQLQVDPGAALRAAAAGRNGGGASFTAAPGAQARAGAVWRGPVAASAQTWKLSSVGALCRQGAWIPLGAYAGGWTSPGAATAGEPQARFDLKPAEGGSALPGPGVYLVAGGLRRSGLETPNPADRWMRDWSFDASSAPALLAARPAFFPTLDLAETADLLEATLDQASASRGRRLQGFAVLLKRN